jgi:thymidylate kinase
MLSATAIALEKIESGEEKIHPALRAAFAALDRQAIAWVLLLGLGELHKPSGDVDLLVDAAARQQIDAVLRAVGFARPAVRGHGSQRFYVAYDARNDDWIKLDVVTDVAFGGRQQFQTPLAPALLARRRRVGAVAVLHPDDAFWHALMHHLLLHGEVPERRRGELRELAGDGPDAGPFGTVIRELHSRLIPGLRRAVATGDWHAVSAMGRALRRAWYLRGGLGVAVRSERHRWKRHVPPPGPPGLRVAILGPDGAGKTTLAQALVASTALPARYVYLGVWGKSCFETRLRRIFGARLAARLVKLIAKEVIIRGRRRLGCLVLLDRYTVDVELPSAAVDLKGRISAMLVRRTNAVPDLIILLDGPVELMYQRKGEHGIAELQRRRDSYLAMRGRFPQMVIIDAAMPADEVRREATRLIWDAWLNDRSVLAPGGSTAQREHAG